MLLTVPALDDVTVIVPLAPGERAAEPLLEFLIRRLPAGADLVVVATDEATRSRVQNVCGAAPVNCILAPCGRASQMNAGAMIAQRQWLWFLHADTRIDNNAFEAIARAPSGDYLGYFDLRFHDGPWLMALNTLGTRLRSRWFRMPFGDQGFLLRRDSFMAVGKFDPDLDCGEDHALVWSLRRAGVDVRPLGACLATSARKYVASGWWSTTWRHLRLTWQQARNFSGLVP